MHDVGAPGDPGRRECTGGAAVTVVGEAMTPVESDTPDAPRSGDDRGDGPAALDDLLVGLRAAAEPSRLRLLAACGQGELTVTELCRILGQSQPRVSRHLKLLCEAGLLDRFREGTWAFYRLAGDGPRAALARLLVDRVPAADPLIVGDRGRLEAIKAERAAAAARYFGANAAQWDTVRALHVDDADVETALLHVIQPSPAAHLLDIGTGTGRMLALFGPRVARAVGIDASRDMLAYARSNLERHGLQNCSVRQGDMYQLPWTDGSYDLVTIHMVLHFADRPAAAIAEAARVLKPGGRLAVIDFAPHELERLRAEHAHRRLGFAEAEVARWCQAAGLTPLPPQHLPGDPLTVTIWTAERRRLGGLTENRD